MKIYNKDKHEVEEIYEVFPSGESTGHFPSTSEWLLTDLPPPRVRFTSSVYFQEIGFFFFVWGDKNPRATPTPRRPQRLPPLPQPPHRRPSPPARPRPQGGRANVGAPVGH